MAVKAYRSFSREDIENEMLRQRRVDKRRRRFWTTILILGLLVAALACLITTVMPVIHITGESMMNTYSDGSLVLCWKPASEFEPGNVIAFQTEKGVLVKRIVATAGDEVYLDVAGDVSVNGEQLEEPYVTNKSLGDCDLGLPYAVPDNSYFVMGDNRAVSVDSRLSEIGCVEQDKIIGKVFFCFWPVNEIGIQ